MTGKTLLFKVTLAINLISVTEDADCLSSEKKLQGMLKAFI